MLLVARWPVGGIRTFIRYVFNNIDNSIFDITIVAPPCDGELKLLLEDLSEPEVSLITFENEPSNWEYLYKVTKTILTGSYDIIYSQGLISGLSSVIPALITQTPHLLTLHDMFLEPQFAGIKGIGKKIFLCMMLPAIACIHTVSNDARENLMEFIPTMKFIKKNIVSIPNGVEIERFTTENKREYRSELSLSTDTFIMGFLGRFMSPKGFVYLVDAIDHLTKNYDLIKEPIVLCFGDGGFIREDKEYIRRKNLERYFRFLPLTNNIAESLKGLDLVVMPSLWEACGLIAMETMVSGIPIIGTNCIGLREVLIDTPAKSVLPKDAVALADAIHMEMLSPSKKNAEEFVETAIKRFDVRENVYKIEKLIHELIGYKELAPVVEAKDGD